MSYNDLLQGVVYLGAAINGLPSIYNDITKSEVTVQLHCVKLSQSDGVGVTYSGHSRAYVKSEMTRHYTH